MTKGEKRAARRAAREQGLPLRGELAVDDDRRGPEEFSETAAGLRARDRWARRYEERNGAPEGDWDR